MTPSESDNYGFFCDIENAKTMEYDKVDYYVVKISTQYEVRRHSSATPKVVPPEYSPHPAGMDFDRKPVINANDDDEPTEKTRRLGKIFSCLARLPRDIYYSFIVCTVTMSCVYLVMTI